MVYNSGMEALDYLIYARRTLHKMPELFNNEFKTSEFLAQELTKMGHSYRRILTGIVCDVVGLDKSRTIGLRADIDALPITEKCDIDYKSTNGNMHACGHDGHSAMLLYIARVLSQRKPKCNVRLIFQFGEEGVGGSITMIEGGAIKNVDTIFAFHMCPELPIGRVASCSGAIFAGAVEFNVEFSGRASHCASPEQGIDALKAANYFACNSQEFNNDCKGNTLLHIGKFTSGDARNIVADKALLECTLRYFDEFQQEKIMMRAANSAVKTDNLFGTKHNIDIKIVYPPVVNSGIAVGELAAACPFLESCAPRYTAEDFAYYCKEIDGAIAWLGCRDDEHTSPLHSSTFGFDEKALLTGVKVFENLIF